MFGWRGRIGLIIPSNNTLIEPELYPCLPEGVSLHAARILTHGSDADSIIEMVKNAERAAQELSAGHVDVIVYCCLSTSLIKGDEWNEDFTAKVSAMAKCPVITAFDATINGLKKLDLSKIALVSPYPREVHKLLLQVLKSNSIDVVSEINNPIEDISEVPNVNPSRVYRTARQSFSKEAEGVCIVATDLPTFSVINLMEMDLKKPVITTNQAILHTALEQIGVNVSIDNYGKLLLVN